MPRYCYRCTCGKSQTVTHSMNDVAVIVCVCGKTMRKAISAPRINWNGNPPSGPQLSPQIKTLLDTTDERRDRYQAKLEQRANSKARAE